MSQSTADRIYEILRERIICGAVTPGIALRQDEIARELGVSKIPVREALLKLEADGFVTFRKNRGATVRDLSSDEILNLIEIRAALECRALELAIPNMIDADYETAAEILETYAGTTQAAGLSALNLKFHQALYEPCGNHILLRLISDVQQRIGPALRAFVTQTSGLHRPHAEHREILAACRAQDIGRAVSLLRDHIKTTRKEVAARLRRAAQEDSPAAFGT
ncbi:GntR family transcriptional regulator [Marinovum sp.]|uniref:GntR family transcriptional regulator n=1 Tax=Marinovum sp. TaxID=2024839 RepID=UPI002B26CB04|nr:GntR family transcriptional regulator [Marinovum sp.]